MGVGFPVTVPADAVKVVVPAVPVLGLIDAPLIAGAISEEDPKNCCHAVPTFIKPLIIGVHTVSIFTYIDDGCLQPSLFVPPVVPTFTFKPLGIELTIINPNK